MALPFRIATFNLENFDDKPGQKPTLDERIALMRDQLLRLRADILCFQEVNGQERTDQPRQLLALDQLVSGTAYAGFFRISTMLADGSQVFDERNLVIFSRFPIQESHHLKHDYAPAPRYRPVSAIPPETMDQEITWERPIQYAKLQLSSTRTLHLIHLHLKSRLASNIRGQKLDSYRWKSASGWAEGYFVSSMKRVGQALETRLLIDSIFDQEAEALIVVCGDFNAEPGEVPVEAICGAVENTGNGTLAGRVLVPCEQSIPESSRYSLYHRGQGRLLDHMLISRKLLGAFRHAEIHNELLHDESSAGGSDRNFPESDHAPFVAEFEWPSS